MVSLWLHILTVAKARIVTVWREELFNVPDNCRTLRYQYTKLPRLEAVLQSEIAKYE